MKISDSFIVQAPIETVWDFLLDIERMSQCVPGIESVEAVDDKTYRGKLRVKIGPISTAFNGMVELTEVEPPHRLVASVSGDDKTKGSAVKAAFESTLESVDNGTQVNYQMDLNLRGKLAQFGSAVVTATAKKMTAEFTKNLRVNLES